MTNPKFNSLLKIPEIKFTIILGSGFHRQALGSNSILSNWEKLLNQYDSDLKLTGFYPLDYEQLVVQRTSKQENEKSLHEAANEMETKGVRMVSGFFRPPQHSEGGRLSGLDVLLSVNRAEHSASFHSAFLGSARPAFSMLD